MIIMIISNNFKLIKTRFNLFIAIIKTIVINLEKENYQKIASLHKKYIYKD